MKEINIDEHRIILMDILSALDEFCTEHGIRYSMEGGTLLGAVRHQGYIPWDDDIDICLLRSDYNRLILEFPDNYKERYTLRCLEKDSNYSFAYANICDERTILFQDSHSKPMGIAIDIFPVDDVPEDESEWLQLRKRIGFYANLRNAKVITFRKGRSVHKNLTLALAKILLLPISLKTVMKKFDKLVQSPNGKGYQKVYESSFGVYGKNPFNKEIFHEIIYYPFEDRKYKGFKNFDNYLANTFGSDYMTPPPVEQQVTHHAFKAYWK